MNETIILLVVIGRYVDILTTLEHYLFIIISFQPFFSMPVQATIEQVIVNIIYY